MRFPEINNLFEKNGFVCKLENSQNTYTHITADNCVNLCNRENKEDLEARYTFNNFYLAPAEGIYRITENTTKHLNDLVLRILQTSIEFDEDTSFHYAPGRWFETKDKQMSFHQGTYRLHSEQYPDMGYQLNVPHIGHNQNDGELAVKIKWDIKKNQGAECLLFGQDGEKEHVFSLVTITKYLVYPSPEFVEGYLFCLNKAEKLHHGKEGEVYEYFSPSVNKNFKCNFVPVEENSGFQTLNEAKQKGKNNRWEVPQPPRYDILQAIERDIRSFGGCYNWTTGKYDDFVEAKKYNEAFAGFNKK